MQNQLGSAITALGHVLTTLQDKTDESRKKAFEFVTDAFKLQSDIMYRLSMTRRAFINPGLTPIAMSVAEDCKIDALLFGQDFPENLKVAKEVERVGKDVTKSDTQGRKSGAQGNGSYHELPPKSARNLNTKGI